MLVGCGSSENIRASPSMSRAVVAVIENIINTSSVYFI